MENETQETQKTQDTQGTPETIEAIKAQRAEEKKAKAAADQALSDVSARLAEKDARIGELEAKLNEADQNFASLNSQVSQLKDAHSKAVSKYLDVVKLANPIIPGDVIAGSTIEDIDASVQKALSIASAVKANLEAQDKEAKVPAGAPPRSEISLEGLSPREKIAAGIQQKGGTQS